MFSQQALAEIHLVLKKHGIKITELANKMPMNQNTFRCKILPQYPEYKFTDTEFERLKVCVKEIADEMYKCIGLVPVAEVIA